jgi:hypothetical protein
MADRWHAIFRLIFLNSDRATISSEAEEATLAARAERQRATAEMDNLLRDLVKSRLERRQQREQHGTESGD